MDLVYFFIFFHLLLLFLSIILNEVIGLLLYIIARTSGKTISIISIYLLFIIDIL